MNIWSKNKDYTPNPKPILTLEDDIKFFRSKEETFKIIEKVLEFLVQNNVTWDLLYMHYRSIEATRMYEIPHQPWISLWRASHVMATPAYIINTDPRTIESLINCMQDYLAILDKAISYYAKHQLINAYLIEPKLVDVIPGISSTSGYYVDYVSNHKKEQTLGNHTSPASFETLI